MNAPVLALIGQIPQAAIGRGLGHLHEIRDQAGIISRLVDFSARIASPTRQLGGSIAIRVSNWKRWLGTMSRRAPVAS